MEFVSYGESDDGIPKRFGPSGLRTNEKYQQPARGIRRLLIANRACGERVGGVLVYRRDGEEEVLSWGPGSTFRGKNCEADRLPRHQFRVTVSGGRDIGRGWRH